MLPVLYCPCAEQCYFPYLSSVFTTRFRADNTLAAAEGEMADGWYGEWTDWRDENEQQASKEPPKKRLRHCAFLAAS